MDTDASPVLPTATKPLDADSANQEKDDTPLAFQNSTSLDLLPRPQDQQDLQDGQEL